jgi:hypothetical protein
MINRKRNLVLAAIAVCCLVPAAFADRGHGCDPHSRTRCQQVAEGGSAAVYVLGAGLTCFGAMFFRSKATKLV